MEDLTERKERLIAVKEVFNTMIDNCIELIGTKSKREYDKELDARFVEKYKDKYTFDEMINIAGNIKQMGTAISYVAFTLTIKDN